MKKTYILPTVALLFAVATASAQVPSKGLNHVVETTVRTPNKKTKESLDPLPVAQANRSISYFDGLGRPLQTVQWQSSPLGRDLVQPIAYDGLGREVKKYLPYADQAGSDGSYRTAALTNQSTFYADGVDANIARTAHPFSQTVFEASPLNRVLEQGAPGATWQPGSRTTTGGRTVVQGHGSNTAIDAVKLWTVTANGASSAGSYIVGKLYKSTVKDENWTSGYSGTTDEFKDLEGRVVLKRVWESESAALNTYYLYDDLGNLRYVLPPAVTANSFTEGDVTFLAYIYAYQYDSRKRVIKKHIPGSNWQEMVYNKLDQLVMSRDANQQANNKWSFIKYDALGRNIISGEVTSATTRENWQTDFNAPSAVLWESPSISDIGYTNNTYPLIALSDCQQLNYYDNYGFTGNAFGNPVAPEAMGERTKGLLTGSKTKVLNSNTWLLTVNYYDLDGRVVRSKSSNHLNGADVVNNNYSFVGELTKRTRSHTVGSTTTIIVDAYTYDHVGRKLDTKQKINTQDTVWLSRMAYNEVGQLKEKKLHSANGSTFLQASKLSYNERGWLKGSSSPEFSIKLGYDTLANPQYNGNIRTQQWGAGTNYANMFNYGYDKLNRLTSAASTGIAMNETITYDVMGNIQTMARDALNGTYNYTGNKLNSISGTLSTGAYSYDQNGNAITDGRTGTNLTYNQLNLPATATRSGLNLAYTYDASGRKLKKVNSSTSTTTDYIDGIQYNNGAIDFIQTEEGQARSNSGSYTYYYNLNDHLGNVRATFYKNPTSNSLEVVQRDDYYAFGLRKEPVAKAGVNKYLYNGKELQEDLGQYDYGARFYDPTIGRWNVIDPMAEKFYNLNPYNYTDNNPVNNTDPDGMLTYYGAEAQDFARRLQAAKADNNDEGPGDVIKVRKIGVEEYEAERLKTIEVKAKKVGPITAFENLLSRGYSWEEIKKMPRWLEISIVIDNYATYAGWGTDNKLQEGIFDFTLLMSGGEVFDLLGGLGKLSWRFGTKQSARAFFSGVGTEAKAIQEGFTTLGQTRAGQNLMKLTEGMPYYKGSQAYEWWARLSAAYAKGIPKGSTVNVFLNNPSSTGIWTTVEKEILLKRNIQIIYK